MSSAKSKRISQLISILGKADTWVSGPALAKLLGTSERSIRNYITELNNRSNSPVIESCKEGYRLFLLPPRDEHIDTPAPQRENYVLSRLVNTHGELSVFDLASELHISESTLCNSVLPHIRRLAKQFKLTCETHNFAVRLCGKEQNKRKLIGHVAAQNAYGYFSSTNTLMEMFPDFDIEGILSKLVEICQRSELIINDFALNNLLVHLLVIIIRISSDNGLSEHDCIIDAEGLVEQFKQRDGIMRCASHIGHYLEREFSCVIPQADYQQIIMLIAISADRFSYDELTVDNLAQVIDQPFLNAVQTIARETTARYGIPSFDESLMLRLTLHMYNACQRATYRVGYPNPLSAQIKMEHAPVYDMAVYFAHRFSGIYAVKLSEDEVSFIAFHLGAYLERCAAPEHTATCVIVVEEYHDFAQHLVAGIEQSLGEDAVVIGVMNHDDFLQSSPECDLVISTIDVPVRHGVKVLIGPILTKQNTRKIQDKLSDVLEEKRMGRARLFLQRIMRPELYRHDNEVKGGSNDCIDYLGALCMENGLVDKSYIEDVHLRESVSSTAFADCLALPHAINEFPERSFIAVLQSDAPIPWGRHSVHFVMLMGIAKGEMGLFRDALDLIIELFSSVDKTTALLQAKTYEEFVHAFICGIS